jgi:Winged helix-turn helix
LISVQTLSRELHAMGYRKLPARPRHHAQAEGAIDGGMYGPLAPRLARFSTLSLKKCCNYFSGLT